MAPRPPDRVTGFACLGCGREFPPETDAMICDACEANLDVRYDYDKIGSRIDRDRIGASRERSLWRYRELLPLHESSGPPPLPVGGTALLRGGRLAEELGLPRLYLKDDTTNPTASFKDRASLVVALRAKEIGVKTISCASTGNAASSLAGIAAPLDLRSVIFVPEGAPAPKMTQMLTYGARVFRVRGTYDDAFDVCAAATDRFGWYSRSTGYNPYTAEGKKTAAFEIAESLGWEAPDWVLVPTGDGNIAGGVGKGFLEMARLGWIERAPRIVLVQAAGAASLTAAFERGDDRIEAVHPVTVADSISVGSPRDSRRALRVVRKTGGTAVAVTDEAILRAVGVLARSTGLFAEPSAAASLAGLWALLEKKTINPWDRVVLMITGHGLKDTATASRLVEEPPVIDPDLASVERLLEPR
ncbi:MAG: threonine synthase [Candidatus Eisenbacteria bacterium]